MVNSHCLTYCGTEWLLFSSTIGPSRCSKEYTILCLKTLLFSLSIPLFSKETELIKKYFFSITFKNTVLLNFLFRDSWKKGHRSTVFITDINKCSPSWELRTASPRGHYGERLQRDSCLKKHMKKHHPLAGDSPWRHYRRDHNIRTAGRIHHQLFRLHWLVCLKKRAFW